MKTEYDEMIKEAVRLHLPGIDWRFYKAQLFQESALEPLARSQAGALGLAQFMPATWKEWAPKAGFPTEPPTNPRASIFTGAKYMSWLIANWSSPRPEIDRYCLALASYNSGLGDVLRAQKFQKGAMSYAEIAAGLRFVEPLHAKEPIDYVKKILGHYNNLVTG